MANARKEAEMVLFESVGNVLRETNVHPRSVRPTLSLVFTASVCRRGAA
jgi:hypothetical protein